MSTVEFKRARRLPVCCPSGNTFDLPGDQKPCWKFEDFDRRLLFAAEGFDELQA